MNTCAAGHKKHDRKKVDTILGEMTIYDYREYMGFRGYCSGQDAVSQGIDSSGCWDKEIHERAVDILDKGDRSKQFLDIGSHIGWFSKLAASLGYRVSAYDADKENLELLIINVPEALRDHVWIDENIEPATLSSEAELVKIDIEGNEQYAIQMLQKSLKDGTINNLIMEISPVFNDSYPALMERMKNYGYEILHLDGKPWNGKLNFDQLDMWFKKQ